MPQEAKLERNNEIVELASNGTNYAEIGRKFSLSRERIRQILSHHSPEVYQKTNISGRFPLCEECNERRGSKRSHLNRFRKNLCGVCLIKLRNNL